MAHRYNVNCLLVVKHLVDHAVIPDANAPKILEALELATIKRTWVPGQRFYWSCSPAALTFPLSPGIPQEHQ
jgi:hypothetical protein